MEKTEYDVYSCFSILVDIFGILGNILVIISVLRHNLLKSNYYFFVLHLAICDLTWLVICFFDFVNYHYLRWLPYSPMYCAFICISYAFQVAGIYMMMVIAVLRYRATVHPLRPAVSRRKLKIFCGFGYILGLIAGHGTIAPECFLLNSLNDVTLIYTEIFVRGYIVSCFYFLPTLFMAIVYYKIHKALAKQSKQMKLLCSLAMKSAYDRNRRIFVVCLCSVLCYGLGNIPMSVWFMRRIVSFATSGQIQNDISNYLWIFRFGGVLRTAGSCSVNPVIYGMLDKKLLKFLRVCLKNRQKAQENEAVVV